MQPNGRKIVIIGGGIGGLCAAVYALKCGYQVEVLEMNDRAGGLAMSWHRGPYTFETCLHWLLGSRPGGEFNETWHEICELDRLRFIHPEEFVRMEDEHGKHVTIYTDADRLEAELLDFAPQDADAIREFTSSVRALGKFRMLDPSGSLKDNWLNMLRDLPVFPRLAKLGKMSGREYGNRFTDPMLKAFFSSGDMGKLTSIAMVLSLAWMNEKNAGYCIGGSQALIRLIEEQIAQLGGAIRFRAKVTRVLVERDRAVGVQLENGEKVMADWVISAADGHATIFKMLGGLYVDAATRKLYDEREVFASYLQVSLGVALDLSGEPPMISRMLDTPINIDPLTDVATVGFRIFNFDPTFAPKGKTVITSLLPTRNYAYWQELRAQDLPKYYDEKHRVADAVIDVLEGRIPGARAAIEAKDVSTPASILRHTGNWKAAQEGWLLEPGHGLKPLPNTLPGLDRFYMVGQWVMPGGGLPSGPLTARPAMKAICKRDRVPFETRTEERVETEMVGV